MQPVTELVERTRDWDIERFRSEYPSPVLVAQKIVGGRLARSQSASTNTGRLSRLKPSTLLHIDPDNVSNPSKDEVMVTRPLSREMWVALRKGPSTPREAPISIGRFASCDVVINDYTVSKRHAFFLMDPLLRRYRVIDAGSTNGTRVRDQWLEPGQRGVVETGDIVAFGRLIFSFFAPQDFWEYLHFGPGEPNSASFDIALT